MKYLIVFAVAAAVWIFFPQTAKAQWTDPYQTYRMNGLIIGRGKKKAPVRKKAARTAPIIRKKARTRPKSKARRVSAVVRERGPHIDLDLPKSFVI